MTVRIVGHGELGTTVTRADGMFDLAVNGGGTLTVAYEKDGFLPVQRSVETPWRDFAWADDVVLTPYDLAVTEVELGSAEVQVARGSLSSDDDGSRRATLIVPADTTAHLVMPNGRRVSVDRLSILRPNTP